MRPRISCIVEGHGEVEALPALLRRMIPEAVPDSFVEILKPIRVSRSRLVRAGELERAVLLAATKCGERGAVLVVLDSDDDCPAELGPALLDRPRKARGDLPIAVVLAKREFEAGFLAGANGLRSRFFGEAPANPEEIRGAKERVEQLLGRPYSETVDQASLAALMDIQQARSAPSFDKLWRELAGLTGTRHPADR